MPRSLVVTPRRAQPALRAAQHSLDLVLGPTAHAPDARGRGTADPLTTQERLGQYPTPCWVSEALIARHFSDLDAHDLVLEPTCGPGRFLQAVPAHVPAVGVELDPAVAAEARRLTGRPVLVGDIRTIPLALTPTAIIGNPPFDMALIDGLLDRAYALLPEGGRMGLILPAYAFQTAARVTGYAERWSIAQEMIPRNVYPGLRLPLTFALFSKDRRRVLVGFALYREAAAVQALDPAARRILEAGGARNVWWQLVETVLQDLGGEADLDAIYDAIEGRRPTRTRFWREQIRRQLQERARRVRRGRWALRLAA